MEHFEEIKALIGERVTEDDLKCVDCYVHKKFGLFIPVFGACEYAAHAAHTHPAYLFTIAFDKEASVEETTKEGQRNTHGRAYLGRAIAPGVPHDDIPELSYYCILIEKEAFESVYRLYANEAPSFKQYDFTICRDILHALNTYVFECSKRMRHAELTLDAQVTLLTHWLVRSLLGEAYDMRAISANYAVGRAQQYMERHFSEKITIEMLSKLGNLSVSGFGRVFKKETGTTPGEYLMEVRLLQAQKLLRRHEIMMTEIAMRCRFNSSAHFTACFHKRFGITPSVYRSKYH